MAPTHPQPPRRPQATPPAPPPATTTPRPPAAAACHNSTLCSAMEPLHDCVVNRVVSFCACHHATSSVVRLSTDSSSSSSSAVFDADPAECLHWHAPPTLHEQPTTGSCSEALASVAAEVTAAEDPEPRREPGPSAMQAATRDRKHRLRDRDIIASKAPAAG